MALSSPEKERVEIFIASCFPLIFIASFFPLKEYFCNVYFIYIFSDELVLEKGDGTRKPWFTMEATNAGAEVGNKATIEAQATGKPMPTFKW